MQLLHYPQGPFVALTHPHSLSENQQRRLANVLNDIVHVSLTSFGLPRLREPRLGSIRLQVDRGHIPSVFVALHPDVHGQTTVEEQNDLRDAIQDLVETSRSIRLLRVKHP